MEKSDLVIIGAGPAGLAAADYLSGSGYSVTLIDSGKHVRERDRHNTAEITRGHGGAGLFSDGKFSFFPSASELWLLPRPVDLRASYDWTAALLRSYGLDTPPFPDDPNSYTPGIGEWVLKDYPSDYLPLEARIELTAQLVEEMNCAILTESEVVAAHYNQTRDMFELSLLDSRGGKAVIGARRLIIATGRFGPLWLNHISRNLSFRRLEVGFRIEQPADQAFFRDMRQLDPKLRFRQSDGLVEWRTFCACRDGETTLTETHGLWTVSGRADGPPTGRSNIGFNTRILDEKTAARTLPNVLSAMSDKTSHFMVSMGSLMAGDPKTVAILDHVYGSELRDLLSCGLSRLEEFHPALRDKEARLIGPTLEGIGWYADVDSELRLRDVPAWVAGDACGLFRGIVAALISGRYVAAAAMQELQGSGNRG